MSLISSLCRICGSNNLLLHQSFCLMQSLINCFFVDPLDNKMSWSSSIKCRDHHQHFDSFQDINGILDDKCHPRSVVIWVTINNILTFLSSQTCSCYGCNLLYSLYYDLPCSITAFLSRMLWELLHLLRILDIVILLAISICFLIPVLFLTGKPTIELWCATSKLLATLLLWS